MLKFWGRMSSINVKKVVWAAQELGLAFERTDAGLHFGLTKTPGYLGMNPNALVPVMDDGGFLLWESNVIVRYLCAKHSFGNLYPQDLQQRFNAERWMDWQQTAINPAGRDAFIQWVRTPLELRHNDLIARSLSATAPKLAMLDRHLAQTAFMAGGQFSMADIPLGCEIQRWWGLPHEHSPRTAYPAIERWYALLKARPASSGVLDLPLS